MLVRSPTFTKRLSSAMANGSRPDRRSAGTTTAGSRRSRPSTAWAIAAMWAGVVPQQPPRMLTKPASANSLTMPAVSSGVSSYSPNALGSPAFG